MNTVGYFEIHSAQPEREIAFYSAVFGWKFIKEEFVPIEYYRIETNGINGGLLKRQGQSPVLGSAVNAFTCSIQVEDFDATSNLILENGGKVALPKFAIPGRCWQGYFMDADHNIFGIFEVNEHAI
ncbi:MAG: lactoylglutathione lyase [Candidatus Fluviicola riflensis]|nr:MAG: lactoylglutathione lyase [Candidatus Fluviicola riflensis]OGS79261.1 MAG: lactoylglutathione lyase [Candidatus Fluviicola riflensis]OGS86693.1 MAG: lactoylglutathione lyase [Fluviicola sp. RIFCSPHIGHO2_01_FULL_43_53]OGS88833.1 MAG: lactoylglutathione lyase [Fluviicola sp. RIFCSPHIGHO2_12_FULL_43_24]